MTELDSPPSAPGLTENTLRLPTTAGDLGAAFGAIVLGDPNRPVSFLSALEQAGPGALCFFADPKYGDNLGKVQGAVVLTRSGLERPEYPLTYLLVEDPRARFAEVASHYRPAFAWVGVSALATVSPSARIHPTARVAPHVVIGDGAVIGAGTRVYPFAYIGAGVEIGAGCEVHPRVTIYDRVRIGNRVKVFSGSVLGSDGFGLFRKDDKGPYAEMPQIGTVVIEDDVRIGANTTIDRAALHETRIGRGTKIDNLVHVAHNCQVGADSVLCAQVGMGGSVVLQPDVILGGQVGLGHGVEVGSGARLGGQCGSTTNVPGGQKYFFTPATPVREFARLWRALRKLPELQNRVKQLEQRQTDA